MVKDSLNGGLLALRRLRGQAGLLAVLMALAVLLSAGAGILLEQLFANNSGFTGMTIAICGAEGEDDLTRRLVSAAALAADVDDYCTIRAMTEEEGRAALEEGRVSALLLLPEGFLDSVLTGENKPVTLLTDGQQPLESWLIGQLGQSVSRMLAAAQAGIYTVLENYDRAGLSEPAREDLIWEVNLAYIGWVADRNDVYETIIVSPTGSALPVEEHYALSVLAYIPLLCSALVYPAFGGEGLMGWYRRLRSGGVSAKAGATGSILASGAVLLPLILLPLLARGGDIFPSVLSAVAVALFSAAFCGLCCVLTPSAGSGALLSFLTATGMLILSGGVLPPVLLPVGLRRLTDWIPLSWARSLLSVSFGREVSGWAAMGLVLLTITLMLLTAVLFDRRVDREEGGR